MSAFHNDAGFVAALDKACGKFINSNAVTKAANSSSKSPELLAKYCDLLLKKSAKNPEEAELEDTLNQVVRFTFYIIYLSKLNLIAVHRWWFLSTLKTKTCSKGFTPKCWLSVWCSICRLQTTLKHQ